MGAMVNFKRIVCLTKNSGLKFLSQISSKLLSGMLEKETATNVPTVGPEEL
jgi:hypothetical protein